MSIGLIGKKQGMTRMFTPEGEAFAVSVNVGLIVAIPALAAFYWLDGRVDNVREDMRHLIIKTNIFLKK